MSQKQQKRIRREIRRQMRGKFADFFIYLCGETLKTRLHYMWLILIKKPPIRKDQIKNDKPISNYQKVKAFISKTLSRSKVH